MERGLGRLIILFGMLAVLALLGACSDHDDDDDVEAVTEEQTMGDQSGDIQQADAQDQQAGDQTASDEQTPDNNSQTPVGPGRLALYNFNLQMNSAQPTLTMSQFQGEENERSLVIRTIDTVPFTGTISPASGQVTLNEGVKLNVTEHDFWGVSEKDFTITVLQPITFQENVPAAQENVPTQGSFAVAYTGNYFVVTFSSPEAGDAVQKARVTLRLSQEDVIEMNADDFEELLDANEVVWKQKANLAFIVLETLSEEIFFVSRTSDVADANNATLQNGSFTVSTSGFAPATQPNPYPATGSRTLVWTDTADDNVIGAGDQFQWQFNWSWENSAGALFDDLTNGQIDLVRYIRTTEQRNGQEVITSLGFQPEGETAGGVTYTNVVHVDVDEDTPGTLTFNPERVFTLNGGYSLLFTEPVPVGGGS